MANISIEGITYRKSRKILWWITDYRVFQIFDDFEAPRNYFLECNFNAYFITKYEYFQAFSHKHLLGWRRWVTTIYQIFVLESFIMAAAWEQLHKARPRLNRTTSRRHTTPKHMLYGKSCTRSTGRDCLIVVNKIRLIYGNSTLLRPSSAHRRMQIKIPTSARFVLQRRSANQSEYTNIMCVRWHTDDLHVGKQNDAMNSPVNADFTFKINIAKEWGCARL